MEISSPTHSRPLPSRPKPSKVANTSISSTTSTITSTKPRIRILLAPYMSPYVVPMNKVETWQLLLTLLEKLFGPSIANPNLRVTDTQGNAIHMHVWEDLLEAGMTIVVDTGSSSILTPVSSSSGPAQAIPSVYASPRLVQVAAPSGKQSASSPEISGKLFSFPGKGGEKAEKAAKLKAGKSSKNGKSPAIMETSGRKDGNPVIGFPVLISKTSMGENLIAISNGKAQAPSETVANRNEVLPVPEGTSEEIATPPSPQKPHDGDEEDKPSQDVVNAVNNPTTLVQPRDISTSQQTALDPEPILSTTEKNSRTVAARRKRSAAARVQEALMVLKTKYVSTSGPPASNAPPRALSSKNYVPPKTDSSNTTSPEDSPSSLKFSESSSGASSPVSEEAKADEIFQSIFRLCRRDSTACGFAILSRHDSYTTRTLKRQISKLVFSKWFGE
ncbi:hypothetical protein DFH27DRAFT_35286 [Peziza echinospora]|nr:hypothetical protein DFH27DRAFT_35286 [Peziza echinospora]